VNHPVAEPAFVQQFELQADMVGERLVAASHHDGHEEQLELVDQSGLDRLGSEVGTCGCQIFLSTSCDLRILMDQPTKAISSHDPPGRRRGNRFAGRKWR
jgi:hypothetical protein